MHPEIHVDPNLTVPDLLVLRNLLKDVDQLVLRNLLKDVDRTKSALEISDAPRIQGLDSGYESLESNNASDSESSSDASHPTQSLTRRHVTVKCGDLAEDVDASIVEQLQALNNPKDARFTPTVFVTWDTDKIKLPAWVDGYLLQPYIKWAKTVVRNQNDVVMLTHLILYFTTSVPSALYLYYNFSWLHGILHWVMQGYYLGTYTLMMHQHIHMRGILAPKYSLFDRAFPFLTDPLMGHTWRSYYYHHVKHHHIEGNGPDDASSTLRFQRDDLGDFLRYVGRFFFLVWYDLAAYFIRKGQPMMAAKAGGFEFGYYGSLYLLTTVTGNPRATLCVFLLPLLLVRLGLMAGNWGQHAFVDEVDPDSDFRSSITLIDVASNRFCYNDGYHTSHHLNPLRHWRDHPVAFLKQKEKYAAEQALVFTNIDYLMLTVRLLRKDYMYLARCMVPIGPVQIGMSLEERAEMLRRKTRRFTEEEIRVKFGRA